MCNCGRDTSGAGHTHTEIFTGVNAPANGALYVTQTYVNVNHVPTVKLEVPAVCVEAAHSACGARPHPRPVCSSVWPYSKDQGYKIHHPDGTVEVVVIDE